MISRENVWYYGVIDKCVIKTETIEIKAYKIFGAKNTEDFIGKLLKRSKEFSRQKYRPTGRKDIK